MDVNDRSPSAFISYARESDDHKEWVKKLAKRLREYRFIAYTGLEDWRKALGSTCPYRWRGHYPSKMSSGEYR